MQSAEFSACYSILIIFGFLKELLILSFLETNLLL